VENPRPRPNEPSGSKAPGTVSLSNPRGRSMQCVTIKVQTTHISCAYVQVPVPSAFYVYLFLRL
jgi:hypothetical protein